jgi:hypothetical protein
MKHSSLEIRKQKSKVQRKQKKDTAKLQELVKQNNSD